MTIVMMVVVTVMRMVVVVARMVVMLMLIMIMTMMVVVEGQRDTVPADTICKGKHGEHSWYNNSMSSS